MYRVLVKRSVAKELSKIPKKDASRIDKAILSLSSNLYPQQCKQLHAKPKTFRIRQGDYRILYTIDDDKQEIIIFRVNIERGPTDKYYPRLVLYYPLALSASFYFSPFTTSWESKLVSALVLSCNINRLLIYCSSSSHQLLGPVP